MWHKMRGLCLLAVYGSRKYRAAIPAQPNLVIIIITCYHWWLRCQRICAPVATEHAPLAKVGQHYMLCLHAMRHLQCLSNCRVLLAYRHGSLVIIKGRLHMRGELGE